MAEDFEKDKKAESSKPEMSFDDEEKRVESLGFPDRQQTNNPFEQKQPDNPFSQPVSGFDSSRQDEKTFEVNNEQIADKKKAN